jgi:hypothetical protein
MESKMRSSRLGIVIFLALAVLFTSNCSYYNRIMSRKNLVDGSEAYKGRKFEEAEALFRQAAERDPDGSTLEGRIAQLFLARTLHSRYIGDRQRREYADAAIAEYKKTLQVDPNEQSAYKAVAGLFENLGRDDEWRAWVAERSTNESIKPQYRAEALTSLAAKQNTCANEISDTEKTKKPIKRDGKDVFQFVKPERPEDFERMRACVAQGTELIDKAIALEPDEIKQISNLDINSLSDAQLQEKLDMVKAFESARSYKTSLTIQASRLAEMDGREPDAARLREEADASRARFTELSTASKAMADAKEARIAAQQQAANANKAEANSGN